MRVSVLTTDSGSMFLVMVVYCVHVAECVMGERAHVYKHMCSFGCACLHIVFCVMQQKQQFAVRSRMWHGVRCKPFAYTHGTDMDVWSAQPCFSPRAPATPRIATMAVKAKVKDDVIIHGAATPG